MNDFTKKELLEIYELLEHHYCNPELCINPNPKLLIKVQSIIDNWDCTDTEDFTDTIIKCIKCCGIKGYENE